MKTVKNIINFIWLSIIAVGFQLTNIFTMYLIQEDLLIEGKGLLYSFLMCYMFMGLYLIYKYRRKIYIL